MEEKKTEEREKTQEIRIYEVRKERIGKPLEICEKRCLERRNYNIGI